MLHAALLLACLQDPDRSTPEKASEAFCRFWDGLEARRAEFWPRHRAAIEALSDPCTTPAYKERVARKIELERAAAEKDRVLSSMHAIASKSDGTDGSVIIESKQTLRRRRGSEESEVTLSHQLVMIRIEGAWLVRELRVACPICLGSGNCTLCGGSGARGEKACLGCLGQKACSACRGEKRVLENLAAFAYPLKFAEPEAKFESDLSTPAAAARTFADSVARRELAESAKLKEFLEATIADLRKHMAPEVVGSVEKALTRQVEEGKQRFKDGRPRVASVSESGETAQAVISQTAENAGEPYQLRRRILLKKIGAEWRVDAEQGMCFACETTGKCVTCRGAGKFEEKDCGACGGSGKCRFCKGVGWME